MLTQIAGIAGLILQISVFLLVFLLSKEGDRTRGAFYAAVSAIYGYTLYIVLGMLLGIPWAFTNVVGLISIAALLLKSSLRQRLKQNAAGLKNAVFRNSIGIVLLASVMMFQVVIAVLKPELSVDGQLYHGPTMVQMIQSGSLWGWSAPSEYLYYSDLSMASGINLATFTGHAIFDDAMQTQHLLVMLLGLNWMLSKRFKSSFSRASFAILIVAAPVIWLQPRILYVDLAYGAAVTSAVFILAGNTQFKRRDVLVAGISMGALLGTKPAGVLTSVLLLAVLIAILLWQDRTELLKNRDGWRKLGGFLPLFTVPLIAGFSMYARNWISFGSPTFPVATDIGPFRFGGKLSLALVSGDPSGKTVSLSHFKTYVSGILDGMTGGLTKLDYDPRSGGFGYVPLFVALLILVLIISQVLISIVRRRDSLKYPAYWRQQIGLVLLAFAVILIQPASLNSRYVIGPTVILLAALVLTGLKISLKLFEKLVACAALIAAIGQISWTETHMYPGLKSILGLRTLNAAYQPLTPGNPWGMSTMLSWLPTNSCTTIAFENSGGVQPGGLMEPTRLATFPYGLYGSQLCNSVNGIALQNYVDAEGNAIQNVTQSFIESADYLVVYSNHVSSWETRLGLDQTCLRTVATIQGDSDYPQDETVLRNLCVAQ